MANRLTRNVRLSEFEGKGRIGGDLPGVPAATGAGAFAAAAKEFDELSSYLNKAADTAAVREGKEAGIAAGLEAEGTVALRRDGTLRGEAYDKAAVDTFASRLDTGMRNEIFDAAEAHRGDPAALAKKLEEIKSGYLGQAGGDPALTAALSKRFDDYRFPYEKAATRTAHAKLFDEAAAAQTENLQTAFRDAARAAFTLGGDADGDEKLAAESARVKRLIQNAKEAGYVTPAAAQKYYAQIDAEIAVNKAQGVFSRLKTLEEKSAFLGRLQEDYNSGAQFQKLDGPAFERMANGMARDIRSEQSQLRVAQREVGEEIKSISGRVRDGYGQTEQEWQRLEAIAAQSPDPALQDTLARGKAAAARVEQWWTLRPDELAAAIAAEKLWLARAPNEAKEVRDERANRVNDMQHVYSRMLTEAQNDMLDLAERTGRAPVTSLSPPGVASPELMAEQFPQRAAAAEEAAASFGLPPQYFNRRERAEWAQVLNAGGEPAAAVSLTLMKMWGPERAARALAELNKEATLVTQAGAVAAAGGSPQYLRDVAEAQRIRKLPGYKPLTLTATDTDPIVRAAYGEAFAQAAPSQAQAVAGALAAFDVRARSQGFATNLQGRSQGRQVFERSLQEAAGAVYEGNVQFGGVASVNGRKTVLPSNIRADRAEDVLAAVRDEDLAADPPRGANGKPLRASDLRSAKLVAVGDGRYHVARGDPGGERPQWFMAAEGEPWVFDLKALEPALKQRRGDLYRGGGPAAAGPRILMRPVAFGGG